jgi:hypothetical protein
MELPEKMVAHGSFDSDLDQNQTFSKNNKHPLKDTKSNSISLEEVSNSLKRKTNECTGSQNEQKKTIKDYFKRLDPQASTEPCPECGNPILLSKLTEHQDFHLALRLEREEQMI